MPFLLYLLAVAVFAQGTSEFVLAGLIPGISADLGVSIAHAGLLTSGFAVGMVVGAPLMAALGRRLPPRWTLSSFLVLFIAMHAIGAVTDHFGVLFASRVVSAFANAGFLAVALSTVTAVVPAHSRGRALAVILSGTTLSLIAGVPVGALIGDVWGWRSALWAIAGLSTAALVAVVLLAPRRLGATDPQAAPRLHAELRTLRSRNLRTNLGLAVLVNGATFCAFTFLTPIVTREAGMDSSLIPFLLALFGVGAFIGVSTAGRLADKQSRRVIAVTTPALLAGWALWTVVANDPLLPWVLSFLQGALSFALGSTLIARSMAAAAGAPTMSGSFATVALNLGAMCGPVLGGYAIGAVGLTGPLMVSAALVLVAAALWGAMILHRRLSTMNPEASVDARID
ncbi:Cmx/CmrA family chloramphenicol efflux MFS transporter [Stackebrandtia soli]|uniref:Cmx/CmrA family chloramphenicol efflux MFS transporter n=1 Tax=Stackebrandtia soli TaxID=1892856 RepID=UPI0039E7EBA1